MGRNSCAVFRGTRSAMRMELTFVPAAGPGGARGTAAARGRRLRRGCVATPERKHRLEFVIRREQPSNCCLETPQHGQPGG